MIDNIHIQGSSTKKTLGLPDRGPESEAFDSFMTPKDVTEVTEEKYILFARDFLL